VAVGGTFDLLHSGHRRLLEEALEVGEMVTVGLTTDRMVSRLYKNHEVEDYDTRLKVLRDFLTERDALERTDIIPLDDPFGPTIDREDFDAIVVSRDTESGAERINEIRRSRGLDELAVVTIDMVLDEIKIPISSTRIRIGIIDGEGRLRRTCSD